MYENSLSRALVTLCLFALSTKDQSCFLVEFNKTLKGWCFTPTLYYGMIYHNKR